MASQPPSEDITRARLARGNAELGGADARLRLQIVVIHCHADCSSKSFGRRGAIKRMNVGLLGYARIGVSHEGSEIDCGESVVGDH